LRITLKSLSDCLKLTPEAVSKICKGKAINNLTYSEIEKLVREYRLKKTIVRSPKNKYGARRIIKKRYKRQTIRRIIDIAFKPLYISVLRYYKNSCVKCNSKNPQIHHIDHNHENMIFENLIPLCWECHKEEHCGILKEKQEYIVRE